MSYEVLASSIFTCLYFWISFQGNEENDFSNMWKKTFFFLGLLQIILTYGFILIGSNATLVVAIISLHSVLTGLLIMLNVFGMIKIQMDKTSGRG